VRHRSFKGWSRRALAALGVALLAVTSASVAIGAPARNVPARDSFRGRIASATGAFEGDSGQVAIYMHPRGSGAGPRKLTLTLVGVPCESTNNCLALNGTAKGTLTTRSSIPDTGMRFTIHASGAVTPMGETSATGHVHGTGFTAKGRERMRLTLTCSDGQVTIDARSPVVKGFTSP
jgi:hypothetical protein